MCTMDEAAYLTDCSTVSHMSESLDGRSEFFPQSILLIENEEEQRLLSRVKPLRAIFNCPIVSVSKENLTQSDIPDGCLAVLDEFEGPAFELVDEKLKSNPFSVQIRGPPAIDDICDTCVEARKRPLFCNSMSSMVFWVSGFHSRKKLKVKIVNLIRYMGGSVTKHSGSRITHIVTDSSLTEGYTYGNTFLTPVLSIEWVYECWARRMDPGFKASDINLDNYKLRIFNNLYICFVGFDQSETSHLEILKKNDGTVVDIKDRRCTHIVVNDNEPNAVYDFRLVPVDVLIVRSEWFWLSIQRDCRLNEDDYMYKEPIEPPVVRRKRSSNLEGCPPCTELRAALPSIFEEENNNERNVGNNNAKEDGSNSPQNCCSPHFNECCYRNLLSNTPLNKKTNTLLELVYTEENYVNILSTILDIQEKSLNPKQQGGALLNEEEARIIFGKIVAIHKVHSQILEDLKKLPENWSDTESLIGPIFSSRRQELLESYLPFIRYYDISKNCLTDCEKKNPRFHAFLQLCKTNEFGRQNMKDLLIRPVQRLASTSLLLQDLIKTTHPSHPDHQKLEEALNNVKEVMNSINNGRKDIADRSIIFDIFNLIENCPPFLVSADRTFIFQFEAQEVTEAHTALSGRGDFLIFYIFTDCLEVCRKKRKVAASAKEGTIISDKLMKLMHGKPFKHVILMEYSTIRSIDNIICEDSRDDIFGLTCRKNNELAEKHHLFRLIKYGAAGFDKSNVLTELKKVMQQNLTDKVMEPKIITKTSKDVQLNLSNLNVGISTLTNFAYRTQVFVKSVLKNGASSPPPAVKQYESYTSASFQKAMSVDNLFSPKHEETSPLETASFPLFKR